MEGRMGRMNPDPLGMAQDAARDAAWEWQRRESNSSSDGSYSNSSKSQSSSLSQDEMDAKRGPNPDKCQWTTRMT